MLLDLDVKRVQRWCEARTPKQFRDQVRVECDIAPRHLTVIEARPPWRADFGPEWTRQPVARLRYTKTAGTWELFWSDRNSRFHRYDLVAPTPRVEDLWRRSTGIPPRSSGADGPALGPAIATRRTVADRVRSYLLGWIPLHSSYVCSI